MTCACHTGCPAAMVTAAVKACQAAGCSANVCNEDMYVESCDQAGLTPCTMALSNCLIARCGRGVRGSFPCVSDSWCLICCTHVVGVV